MTSAIRILRTAPAAAAKAVQSRIEAHDAQTVPVIRAYRAIGLGYGAIADKLNSAGDLAPLRGGRWTKMQVARICRRYNIEREGIDD